MRSCGMAIEHSPISTLYVTGSERKTKCELYRYVQTQRIWDFLRPVLVISRVSSLAILVGNGSEIGYGFCTLVLN